MARVGLRLCVFYWTFSFEKVVMLIEGMEDVTRFDEGILEYCNLDDEDSRTGKKHRENRNERIFLTFLVIRIERLEYVELW